MSMTPAERLDADLLGVERSFFPSGPVPDNASVSFSPPERAQFGVSDAVDGYTESQRSFLMLKAVANQLLAIVDAIDGLGVGAGSRVFANRRVSSDTTLTGDDYWLGVTDTSVARTVTLPTAVGRVGKAFVVKDESGLAGTNAITVDGSGSETVDGSSSVSISANYGSVRLMSDGSNWLTW